MRLPSASVPIGVLENTTFDVNSYPLPPDTTLLIYSDGAFELTLPNGGHWRLEDFVDLCAGTARSPHWTLDDLVDQLRSRTQTGQFDDDCTLVRVTIGPVGDFANRTSPADVLPRDESLV